MKLAILAASLLAFGATAVSAQGRYAPPPLPTAPVWSKDSHSYPQSRHRTCQQKAWNLHNYEKRAASDGRVDRRERDIIRGLERDLNSSCGRHRWNG
jgi:hypothetical protein